MERLKLARSQSRLSFDPAISDDADKNDSALPRVLLQRSHSHLSFLSRSSHTRENSNQSTTLEGDADDETSLASHAYQAKRPMQTERWGGGRNWKPPVHAKTGEQSLHLSEVISSSLLFEALPKKELNQVKQAMRGPHRVLEGMDVIRQDMLVDSGEAALYILESGKLAAFVRSGDLPHPGILARQYDRKGQFFGEMALVFKCPRFATIEAQAESTLWSLDRDSFNHLLRDSFLSLRNRARTCLERCLAFGNLDQESRNALLDSMEMRKFETGELITTLRSESNNDTELCSQELFIIESGRAVSSRDFPTSRKRNTSETFYEPWQLFGMHLGLPHAVSECKVQAQIPTVCAVVYVQALQMLLDACGTHLTGALPQEPWTCLLAGRMPLERIDSSSDVSSFYRDTSEGRISRSRSVEDLCNAPPSFFSFLWPCTCTCRPTRDENDAEARVDAKLVVD